MNTIDSLSNKSNCIAQVRVYTLHREKLASNFTRLLLDFPSNSIQLVNLLANIAKSSKLPHKLLVFVQYLVNLLDKTRDLVTLVLSSRFTSFLFSVHYTSHGQDILEQVWAYMHFKQYWWNSMYR